MEYEYQEDLYEPEINLLREWLPKIKREDRSYIKGALNALLYVQEKQEILMESEV